MPVLGHGGSSPLSDTRLDPALLGIFPGRSGFCRFGKCSGPAATGSKSRVATPQAGPARELLDEAMTVFEQLGAEDYVLDTRLRIAEWELLAGSPAAALVILDDTSPAISRIGDPGILPVTEARLRGFVLLAADRAADARRAFRRAHTIASRDSFEFEMAMADLGLSACGDEFEHHRVGAEALLRHLGVKAPPPTTGPITPPGRSPG